MLSVRLLYRYQWYYHLTVLYLYQYLWYVRQCSIGISDTIIWQCSTCISICDAMSDSALSVSVILSSDSALLVSVSVMLCQTVLYRYQWYYHLTVLYLYQYLWCYVRQCSIGISDTIIWQCSNWIGICDAIVRLCSIGISDTIIWLLYLYRYLWCYVRQCSIGISDTIWQCSTCIGICDAMSDSALSVSVILSFDSALLVSVSVMLSVRLLYQYQWYYHLTVLYLYQYLWCYVRLLYQYQWYYHLNVLLVSVSVILSSDCSISITINICISIIFDSFIHPKEGSSTSVWTLSVYSDSSLPHFGGVQSSCSSKKIYLKTEMWWIHVDSTHTCPILF